MERLESLREKIQSPNGQKLTGMLGSHRNRDLSDYMVKIEEYEKDIVARNHIMQHRREQIRKVQNKTARTYLTLKYIKLYTMTRIAEKMNRTVSWAKKYHRKALEIFADANEIK